MNGSRRLEKLRNVMKENNISYYLVQTSDPHQSEYISAHYKGVEYLTGFTGSNGTVLVGLTSAVVWTDGRYAVQIKKELANTEIDYYITNEPNTVTLLSYLKENLHKKDVLGADGSTISAYFGEVLQKTVSETNASWEFETDLLNVIWKGRPEIYFQKAFLLDLEYVNQTLEEKIEKVRHTLINEKCQGTVISKLDDIMWLLNIRGTDIKHNLVALSHLIIEETKTILFIYKKIQSAEFIEYCKEHNIDMEEYDEFYEYLKKYEFSYDSILVDSREISIATMNLLVDKVVVVAKTNPTRLSKAIKGKKELVHLEQIYLEDSVIVTRFMYWLQHQSDLESLTEYSIAMYLDELRKAHPKFLSLSFDTICAYQENAAMMHYCASKHTGKFLKGSGTLLVDSGAHYYGGTTDVTRTFLIGEVSTEIVEKYCAVVSGMLRLQNAVFMRGCTGRNLDILARSVLWKQYSDYKCGTGHGIGYMLNVHEGPQAIRYQYQKEEKETIFEAGMVTSNEPGVYCEGEYGIRIENVMYCIEKQENKDGMFLGFQPLTYVPFDPKGIDVTYLTSEDIININEYQRAVYEKISPYLEEAERVWLQEVTKQLEK